MTIQLFSKVYLAKKIQMPVSSCSSSRTYGLKSKGIEGKKRGRRSRSRKNRKKNPKKLTNKIRSRRNKKWVISKHKPQISWSVNLNSRPGRWLKPWEKIISSRTSLVLQGCRLKYQICPTLLKPLWTTHRTQTLTPVEFIRRTWLWARVWRSHLTFRGKTK